MLVCLQCGGQPVILFRPAMDRCFWLEVTCSSGVSGSGAAADWLCGGVAD